MTTKKTGIEDLPGDDWESRFTKQVVRNIARYKDERNMSTVDLAARYSEAAGEPGALKSTTLNNLLAGKRSRIAITEILLFAQALNVPPIALVFASDNRNVEVSPRQSREMQAFEGYRWFLGEVSPLSTPDRRAFDLAGSPFRELRWLVEKQHAIELDNAELIALERAQSETGIFSNYGVMSRERELSRDLDVLNFRRQKLGELGVHLPYLPEYLEFVDEDPFALPSRLPITSPLSAEQYKFIDQRRGQFVLELKAEESSRAEHEEFKKSDEYREWLTSDRGDESPA